jgi:dTMP kinase
VEGTTGVGKTTVTRWLARTLGAATFHYPPEFVRFRRAVGLDERIEPPTRLAYYLAATMHLSDTVRSALQRGPVVCDRYMASPLGLVEASGLDQAIARRLSEPFLPHLERPSLIVLLTADHQEAVRRASRRRRTVTPAHLRAFGSPAFFQAWEDAVRRHAERLGPVVPIDTSGHTRAEVFRLVSSCLGEKVRG